VGDLFDNHRPADALVESVVKELEALVQGGKTVVTVPGNHDEITYNDSVYRRYANRWPGLLVQNPMPEHLGRMVIKGEPLHLYSMAYIGGLTRIDGLLSSFPRVQEPGIHLAALHGSLNWQTGERGLPLDKQALTATGYTYVALGHFHGFHQERVQATTLAYAGAVESKGYGDLGCGQLLLVDLEPTSVRLHPVPWPVRPSRCEELDVGSCENYDVLEQAIAAWADPELMLRVTLQGTAHFLVSHTRLLQRLGSFFYHLEIADDSLYLSHETLVQWAQEPTVRGFFVRRMLDRLASAEPGSERMTIEMALRHGVGAFAERGD
jgi:DNA repair exonuclease SbcCD nuclease subunit